MKRGEPIKVSWKDIIPAYPNQKDMVGYSTVEQIAKVKNLSLLQAQRLIKKLIDDGKIEGIKVRLDNGYIGWMVKD